MLYTLLTNFGDDKFDLTSNDGMAINTNAVALKKKTDMFGSIFNMDIISSYCKSRKLSFGNRILVRPGLVNCILTGSYWKPKVPVTCNEYSTSNELNTVPLSVSERCSKETRLEELKGEILELNRQFSNQNSKFNLKKIDQEIKVLKRQKKNEKDKKT